MQPFPTFSNLNIKPSLECDLFKKQLGGYTEPFAGGRPCWAGQSAGVPFTTDL